MTTPVSYEIAELLKQKGFNLPTREFWYKEKSNSKEYIKTGVEYHSDRDCIWDWNNNSGNGIASPYPNKEYKYQYSAPSISEVVMWLYEKHGIWISVSFANKNQWYFNVDKFGFSGKEKKLFLSNYEFKSPTEAYQSAITYTLNNLI